MTVDASYPVKTTHNASYESISPSLKELSQAGRTVLVTGRSSGIGLAIARGFTEAHASAVILTGRTIETLSPVASRLAADFPETKFVPKTLDIANIEAIDAFGMSWISTGQRSMCLC